MSRNPDRVMDGGDKCLTGALVFHREGQTLPWPGLQRTRGTDAPALLQPSGLLVPPTTSSNQQGPRRQGQACCSPLGSARGPLNRVGEQARAEERTEGKTEAWL